MRLHRGKHYVLRWKPERNDCKRKKQTYHKKHGQECFFVAEAEKPADVQDTANYEPRTNKRYEGVREDFIKYAKLVHNKISE